VPEFGFDPAESDANFAKHGIDFVTAQALWADERLLEIAARSTDGLRFVVIAATGGNVWSAVCTLRGDRVRIISARRAPIKEVALYEGQ